MICLNYCNGLTFVLQIQSSHVGQSADTVDPITSLRLCQAAKLTPLDLLSNVTI